MPTLTKALGQWQLPLADGVRVRTHVPGVWGSIPSQVDPVTFGAQRGAGRLDRYLTFPKSKYNSSKVNTRGRVPFLGGVYVAEPTTRRQHITCVCL